MPLPRSWCARGVSAGVGGAQLAKDPSSITLLDVFHAVEDEAPLFHMHENPNPECQVGGNIQAVLGARLDQTAQAMEEQLSSVTLQSLARDIEERIS